MVLTVREQDTAAADLRCLCGLATNKRDAEQEEQEEIAAGDADGGSGAATAWNCAIIA
jgi:hypothetical protein